MSCEAERCPSALVIGYGSSLRGDDQAGPVAAGQLSRLGFACRVAAQLTPELAADIAAARRVIFLDASVEVAPGEIAVLPLTPQPVASGPFDHHLTPAGLLQLAVDCYNWRGEAYLIAIGCDRFALGENCSTPAQRAIARAIRAVCDL